MTATYTWDVFCTLDGYGTYGPDGDWGGYWSKQGPELLEYRASLFDTPQRMVFGATTFRENADILLRSEDPHNQDEWNRRTLRMPATVISSTVHDTLGWPDATVVSGDAGEIVTRLKEESDLPLRSQASLSLNRSLMAPGLVDRIELTIFPVISGRTWPVPATSTSSCWSPGPSTVAASCWSTGRRRTDDGQMIDVGILTPHGAARADDEFCVTAGKDVRTHVRRISLDGSAPTSPEELRAHADPSVVDATAAELDPRSLQAIAYASTSTAYLLGHRDERELIARLADRWDVPVCSTSASAVDALRRLGAERLAVVHPPWFGEERNALGATSMRSSWAATASVPPEPSARWSSAWTDRSSRPTSFSCGRSTRASAPRSTSAASAGCWHHDERTTHEDIARRSPGERSRTLARLLHGARLRDRGRGARDTDRPPHDA